MKRAGILIAFALLAVGPAGASPCAHGRPIMFVSNWAPHFRTSDIYVVHARGGRSRNLTNNELDDVDPSWSPDGKQVVFASRRRGSFDLYVMNARGGGVRRLLALPGDQRQPVWSPDGKLVAFVSPDRRRNEKGWRPSQLFVMTAYGTGVTQVTHGDNGAGDPAWSPDGTKLAGSDGYIFTVNLDGSDFHELQPAVEAEFDAHPSWSPDGKRVAFDRGELDFSTTDLWTMNVDGTGQRRLARFGAQPSWSPDGRTIAFVNGDVWQCDPDGCAEEGLSAIATIRASGGRRRYVTRPLVRLGESFGAPARFLYGDGATFFGVRWSRDGRELLYARRLDERVLDLFSLVPGGRPKQLTHTPGTEANPVASPDGRRVMFARYPIDGGGPGVFVRDAEGRVRRLAVRGYVGSWSPDGRRLAFVGASDRRALRIYVAGADGSHPRRLVDGIDPTWSPDARRIAFVQLSQRDPYVGDALGVIDAAGGGARSLLHLRRHNLYGLAWSPAGDWIAFVNSHPTKLSSFVELVNADSAATRHVTSGRFWDGVPVWSPDGRRLAFDRRLRDSSDLVAVVVCRWDGRGAHRLGKWRWREFGPSWSPNGRRLVLASRRNGTYEITTVNPDGTGRRALTHDPADNIEASW